MARSRKTTVSIAIAAVALAAGLLMADSVRSLPVLISGLVVLAAAAVMLIFSADPRARLFVLAVCCNQLGTFFLNTTTPSASMVRASWVFIACGIVLLCVAMLAPKGPQRTSR